MYLISLIIPVYNTEKTLDRVMQSIESQTSKEFQAIFVDDGSTDAGGDIIDSYADKYDYVKTVHKQNGGLSSARNAGMKVADGEYIAFLDADDYLEKDAMEKIIKVVQNIKIDILDFGFFYVPSSGEKFQNLNHLPKNEILGKNVLKERVIPRMINVLDDEDAFIFDFAWNKVYKKEIIEREKLHFLESRRIWEDRVFLVQYLKYCENYYSIGDCLINYVYTSSSLSQRYSLQFFDLILENYYIYLDLYGQDYSFDSEYALAYWSHSVENMLYRSASETTLIDSIRVNVVKIIKDESVRKWFAERKKGSSQEKKVAEMVLQGDVELLLKYFCKKRKKEEFLKNSIILKALRYFKRLF